MAKVFIYFIFFSRNNKGVTFWISGYPTIIPFLVQNSPKMVFFDDFDRVFGYPIIITLVFWISNNYQMSSSSSSVFGYPLMSLSFSSISGYPIIPSFFDK